MLEIFEPVEDEFDPLSQKELSLLESSLDNTLPSDYKKFLMKYGRCVFTGETLITAPDGQELEVFTMFSAKGDVGNFLSDMEMHPEYLANSLIPIADDMFNNRYVLNLNSGDVSFIDYSNGTGLMILIAKNFTEFLNSIEVIPD